MMPFIQGVFAFLVALAVSLGCMNSARAETIPAQPSSDAAYCASVAAGMQASETLGRSFSVCSTSNGCQITCTGGPEGGCPTSCSGGWNYPIQTTYSCPSGYTMLGSGSSATCYKADTPTVNCPSAGTSSGDIEWSGSSDGGISVGGCGVTCQASVQAGSSGGGSGCKYTGAAAETGAASGVKSPSDAPVAPTPASCMQSGSGYITSSSGSTSCIDAKDSPVPLTATTTTKTATGTRTDTVVCQGGECTVTRTDTPTSGTPESTTEGKSAFCEANPNAAICKGDDYGTPSDEASLSTTTRGFEALPSVTIASNNSCPSNINLPHGAVFKFDPICDAMGWLKPVVLAMAFLSAGLIVVGGIKGD